VHTLICQGFSRQVTEAEGLELAGRLGTLFIGERARTGGLRRITLAAIPYLL